MTDFHPASPNHHPHYLTATTTTTRRRTTVRTLVCGVVVDYCHPPLLIPDTSISSNPLQHRRPRSIYRLMDARCNVIRYLFDECRRSQLGWHKPNSGNTEDVFFPGLRWKTTRFLSTSCLTLSSSSYYCCTGTVVFL